MNHIALAGEKPRTWNNIKKIFDMNFFKSPTERKTNKYHAF